MECVAGWKFGNEKYYPKKSFHEKIILLNHLFHKTKVNEKEREKGEREREKHVLCIVHNWKFRVDEQMLAITASLYDGRQSVCFIGLHEGIQRIENKCNGNCVWLLLIRFSMGQALHLVVQKLLLMLMQYATIVETGWKRKPHLYFCHHRRHHLFQHNFDALHPLLYIYIYVQMGCLALIFPCFGCHHDLPLIINVVSDSCDLNYLMCCVLSTLNNIP